MRWLWLHAPHGEGHHDAVGVLLADLGDEERAHARAGAAAKRVRHLEALEAVARLGLLAHDVEDRVDELSALRVVALGPVVARARLAEHEVVGPEELSVGARAHTVHGAGLEVKEHSAGHCAGGEVRMSLARSSQSRHASAHRNGHPSPR